MHRGGVASVTALKAILARIAEVMDRDVRHPFLFLTRMLEGAVLARFLADRLKALDPKILRPCSTIPESSGASSWCPRAIRAASVDALKDENSLVITASRARPHSFGCSNEADFTYFGKPISTKGAARTYSFIEALRKSKRDRRAGEGTGYEDRSRRSRSREASGSLAALEKSSSAGRRSSRPPQQRRRWASTPRFVDLWVTPELIASYRSECVRSMTMGSRALCQGRTPTISAA